MRRRGARRARALRPGPAFPPGAPRARRTPARRVLRPRPGAGPAAGRSRTFGAWPPRRLQATRPGAPRTASPTSFSTASSESGRRNAFTTAGREFGSSALLLDLREIGEEGVEPAADPLVPGTDADLARGRMEAGLELTLRGRGELAPPEPAPDVPAQSALAPRRTVRVRSSPPSPPFGTALLRIRRRGSGGRPGSPRPPGRAR